MRLETKNISYQSKNKYLFRNLNINLLPGELLMVQGQNGAGKSTLLKILVGLLSPKKGGVYWQNESIAQSMSYHKHLAYLGHQDGLRLELTAMENMKLQAALSQCKADQKTLLNILSCFTLPNTLCHQLSAGQKRKVALGALLLKNKPLWILDEPYTALDKQSMTQFNEYLYRHLRQNGMVVMASHIPFENPHQVINL